MNKRPSLQFYPADWLKDPDLQICSMNTIGVWINLLCRMWEAKEEGVLRGKAGELALLVGARPGEFNRFLRDAETHSFADVTKCNGYVTVKCRRMNKVFLEREGAKMRMKRHRGKKENADVTSPSSSSLSSSTSSSDIKNPLYPLDFLQFWKEYPRKVGKGYAHACWKKVIRKTSLEVILQAVADQKQSEQWLKENGKYIPNPATWLNQERWGDELKRKETLEEVFDRAEQKFGGLTDG